MTPLTLYVCGPTVYAHSHIGHARTYIMVDVINRIMNNLADKRTYLVMNITDIDDKIINKSVEEKTEWRAIAKRYEKSFFDSMAKLNVRIPNTIIRVSEVIPQIIQYIQKIIDNGFAYMGPDSSVYFDSEAYVKKGYQSSDLVDEDETVYNTLLLLQKKNKKDFALWKKRPETDIGFDAEFVINGRSISSWGRPGWHIECSTMIHETIGPNLDIHLGGIDLKFPHHHNERTQAHAYYHPQFIENSWSKEFLHIGHLCIAGLKMSKSLKNFITIDEALKEIDANLMRWMFILHKWTDQMDYSDNTIKEAKGFEESMTNFFNRVANYPFDKKYAIYTQNEIELDNHIHEAESEIISKLVSFKCELATSKLAELVSRMNAYLNLGQSNEFLVRSVYDWIRKLLNNLGFNYQINANGSQTDLMNVLIETRSAIRELSRDKIPKEIKQKLFQILDTERNVSLPRIGISLEDTKDSSLWHQ